MLTDAFHKRYPQRFLYGDKFPYKIGRLLNQAAQIIGHDLYAAIPGKDKLYEKAHKQLAREYGIGRLGEGTTYEEICIRLICDRYDIWNDSHVDLDYFLKMRMGLIELLFRGAEEYLDGEYQGNDLGVMATLLSKRTGPKSKNKNEKSLESFMKSFDELNARFREAEVPFTYNNGYIQLVGDPLAEEKIEKPFWRLTSDNKWKNVDYEMKEAFDRRDAGKEDSVSYALQALESTIKVISDEKGWTSGNEKGASNYIDNLVSSKNGCFIDLWEAEAIRHLFTTLRNPRSHGVGSGSRPSTHEQQRVWIIESCMIWIKSLIKRL